MSASNISDQGTTNSNDSRSLRDRSRSPTQRAALHEICFFDLAETARKSLHNVVLYLQPEQERSKNRKIERLRRAIDLTKAHAAGTDILLHALPAIPEDHSLLRVLPEYARLLGLLSQRIDNLGSENTWSSTLSRSGLTRFLGYVQISNRVGKDESLATLLRQIRRCQKRVCTKLALCRKGQDDQVVHRRFSELSLQTCVEPSAELRRSSTASLDSLACRVRGCIGSEILDRKASEVFEDAPRLCHDRHLAFFLEECLGGQNMSRSDFKELSAWLRQAQGSEDGEEEEATDDKTGLKAMKPRALWDSIMLRGFTISQ